MAKKRTKRRSALAELFFKPRELSLSTARRLKIGALAVVASTIAILLALNALDFLQQGTPRLGYFPDKAGIRAELQEGFDKISLPGEQVFSEIVDEGCDSRNAVGLQYFVHCDFAGAKLYKGVGNLERDLRAADAALRQSGWQREVSDIHPNEEFDQALTGTGYQPFLDYKNPESHLGYIRLDYYENAGHQNETVNLVIDHTEMLGIEDLIAHGYLKALAPGEYIYGVDISSVPYWSCRGPSSWLSIYEPCPDSPSHPGDRIR